MAVDVICLRDDSSEPAFDSLNGVNIRRVPLRRRRGGKASYLFQYAAFISICFALLTLRSLRRRYHLVHVHNMPDVLVFSALVPKLLGARVVLDLHDPMPELMMTIFNLDATSRAVAQLKRFERWSIALADTVFTVNQACKRMFGTRSCKPEKVRVIMNSPDERLFTLTTPEPGRPRDPAKPFVIMYHGSLVERHGLDLAVEALDRAKKTDSHRRAVRLRSAHRISGSSHGYGQSAGASGLRSLSGSKRIEDVAQAIRTCDLGIIPNRRSIFTEINTPTRIFEYLTCGKPVIAPCVPGIRDYFADGQLIFLNSATPRITRQDRVRLRPSTGSRGNHVTRSATILNIVESEERLRLVEHVSQILNGHAYPFKG